MLLEYFRVFYECFWSTLEYFGSILGVLLEYFRVI